MFVSFPKKPSLINLNQSEKSGGEGGLEVALARLNVEWGVAEDETSHEKFTRFPCGLAHLITSIDPVGGDVGDWTE